MNETLTKILNFCEQEVKNDSAYVWGGSGELGVKVTEAWIRKKEARSKGGARADDAVDAWESRKASGNVVFRVFDCSGYVSAALGTVGLVAKHINCDSLWSKCEKIGKPFNGALLFCVNDENREDETHVGLYFNGYQYHSKGRNYGVVKERYDASDWDKIGWFKAIPKDVENETSEPVISVSTVKPPYVLVLGKSVNIRNGGSVKYDVTGVAHKGDKYPYQGRDAGVGWYMIEVDDMTAFISDNPKYTRLVEK